MGRLGPWLIMASVSQAVYLLAFGIPFFLGNHFATPRLILPDVVGYRPEIALAYTGAIIVLCGVYYLGYRALRANPGLPAWAIYLPPVAFALTLLAIYPPGGWDIFLYISQGRLLSQYHLNPYLVSPADLSGDLLSAYASWFPYPSTYGPAWAIISGLLTILGGDNLWLNMLLFKGTALVFFFADVVLIHLILARVKPGWQLLGGFLLAWNPMVLFEVVGNSHNDAVLIFFALLAVFFLVERKLLFILPLLALSVLVKYASILLLPLFLVALWRSQESLRERASTLAVNLALSAAVAAVFLRPFEGAASFASLVSMEDWFRSSPATLLMLALQGNFPPAEARTIAKAAAAAAFAYAYLWQLLRFLRGSQVEPFSSLFWSSHWSLFFVVLFIPWFVPWYFIWAIAFALLIGDHRLNERMVLLSLTAFLSHIVYYFVSGIYGDRINYFTIEVIANLVIFAPPLAHWWFCQRRRRSQLLSEKEKTIAAQEVEIGRLKALSAGPGKGQRLR